MSKKKNKQILKEGQLIFPGFEPQTTLLASKKSYKKLVQDPVYKKCKILVKERIKKVYILPVV